jgi:hypothetical protein
MHQQLGGSPEETAANMRAVLAALDDVNIRGIGPSFDPPHIRVLVEDGEFDKARRLMDDNGLEPTIHTAVTLTISDAKGRLRKAMAAIEDRGNFVDAILVVPGAAAGKAMISFGLIGPNLDDWTDQTADDLAAEVLAEIEPQSA